MFPYADEWPNNLHAALSVAVRVLDKEQRAKKTQTAASRKKKSISRRLLLEIDFGVEFNKFRQSILT